MSSNGQRPRWTIEQRTSLHLLNTKYIFSNPSTKDDDIARIFNHAFREEVLPAFPDGRSAENIKYDYRAASGHYTERSKMWGYITGKKFDAERPQREQTVMTRLRATIQTLGLGGVVQEASARTTSIVSDDQVNNSNNSAVNAVASLPSAGPLMMPPPPARTQRASAGSKASTNDVSRAFDTVSVAASAANLPPTFTMPGSSSGIPHSLWASSLVPETRYGTQNMQNSNTASNSQGGQDTGEDTVRAQSSTTTTEASASTSQEQDNVNPLPMLRYSKEQDNANPLPMLHHNNFFWDGTQADSANSTYIDTESPIYKLGGKVYRATTTEGIVEDIMICSKDVCARCRDDSSPPLSEAVADAAKVEGLPFIHHYDCVQPHHMRFWWFLPKGARRFVVSPWSKNKPVDDEDDEIVVSPGIQNVPADDESDNIVVSPGIRKVPADDEGDKIEVSAETGHVSAVQSTANKDGLGAVDKKFKALHGSATKQPATKAADARRSARITSNKEKDANNAADSTAEDQTAADQTAVVKSSKQSDKRKAVSAPDSQSGNLGFAIPSSSSSPPAMLRMQETRSQTNAAKASASKPVKKPLHGSLGASTDIDPDTSHDNDPLDDQIEPRLEMIHGGQCSWPTGLRYNDKHYVNHEHEIYKLGGTVRRCFVNGKEEDVMLCNEKYCVYCMDRTTKVTNYGDVGPEYHISAEAHAETNDLPFVHAKTCSVPHPGGGFHFIFKGVVPTSRGWGPLKYPASTFTTNVTFRGRGGVLKRVKTTMCVHGQCVECGGQEAVDKKKARYESGGDLYVKKKRVEEMKKQAEAMERQAEEMKKQAQEKMMQAEEMEKGGSDAESAG